ncbi:hypothetical protein HK103_003203 [Boothiomyces macroporosus]|uniref:Uncharacterized protein n=1 Tax=Boothiomyces macroporosus TaxID=261099 RepID=A0AAD5Y4A0_9FUNG|nr:hypothetical protein HK103_003203 [Boothiomyces macroporosus]
MESHELVQEISKYKPDIHLDSLQIQPLTKEQMNSVEQTFHAAFALELKRNIKLPPAIHGLESEIDSLIQKNLKGDSILGAISDLNNKVVSDIHGIVNNVLNELLAAEIDKKKAELEALQNDSLKEKVVVSETAPVDNKIKETETPIEKKGTVSFKETKDNTVDREDDEITASQHSLNEDTPKRKSTFGSGIRNMLGHLTKQRAPKPKKGQQAEEKHSEKHTHSSVENAKVESPKVAQSLAEQPKVEPTLAESHPQDPTVQEAKTEPVKDGKTEIVKEAKSQETEIEAVEEHLVQPKRYVPTNAMSALASAMKSGLGEKARSHGKSITDMIESKSSDAPAQINPRPNPSSKPRPVTMIELNSNAPPPIKPRPVTSVDDKLDVVGENNGISNDQPNTGHLNTNQQEADLPGSTVGVPVLPSRPVSYIDDAPPIQPRPKQQEPERPISQNGSAVLPKVQPRPILHTDDPPKVQPRVKSPELPERQMSVERSLSQADEPPATLPRPRPPILPERQTSVDRPLSHVEAPTSTDSPVSENAPPPVTPRVKSPQLPSRPTSENRPLSTIDINSASLTVDDEIVKSL